jgi:hypothetical protein
MRRVSSLRDAGTKIVVSDFFRTMLARSVTSAPRRNRKDPICLHSEGRRLRAPIGKHQFTRRRIVAHLEQVLNFRVT